MKRKLWPMVLFLVSFVATYVVLCFVLTGAKMAAEATFFDYIRVAVAYMAVFKTVVSFAVAGMIGSIPRLLAKRKQKET